MKTSSAKDKYKREIETKVEDANTYKQNQIRNVLKVASFIFLTLVPKLMMTTIFGNILLKYLQAL